MKSQRVTSRDVAKKAGVSQTTVSYVLNNNPKQSISSVTQDKVRQAAIDLGYTPSAAARTLRLGASETVLIMIPDAQIGEMTARSIEGITHTLEPHGYTAIYRRQSPEITPLQLCKEFAPVALANINALSPEQEREVESFGVPVAGSTFGPTDTTHLGMPQAVLGELQVRHLHEKDHKHILYAAPDIPDVAEYYKLRLSGALKEAENLDLPALQVLQIPFDLEGAITAAQEILALSPKITAVAAYNDEVAMILMVALLRLHARVPEQIAVIGVDNTPLSPFAYPSLTTIDVHAYDIGVAVGKLVLRRLQPDLEITATAPESLVKLIIREST